jgi:arylsulfatase A-like enzyme
MRTHEMNTTGATFFKVDSWIVGVLMLASSTLLSAVSPAQEVLPVPPAPFKGEIGLSAKDSKSDFPTPVHAPQGAPNVVLILLDDVGFGASSTFGGLIQTPTLEKLAENGLRYTQFHTTALCSPTRAALLTGRNHHSAHTGTVMEMATGFPGYDSLMGKETATVAEILRQHGWNTAWLGKNHNVPDWQTSQAGPFDLWPTALGFDFFYGFVGGETNQWRPAVFEGTKPIEPYLGNPDYNFDYDIADQAIKWVRNQKAVAPDRPFFLYYAPGATHSPHQPKKEWIAKYKGKFDQGWDKVREQTLVRQKRLGIVPANPLLTPRIPGVPAWDSLNPEQKQLDAYMMEIYAGYLEQTDYNVGRVLDAIKQLGQFDNTLVIYIVGDNGASAEGTMQGALNEIASLNSIPENFRELLARRDDLGTWKTHNHYPIGWAHAMNTPFQWAKQVASHYGGTRNAPDKNVAEGTRPGRRANVEDREFSGLGGYVKPPRLRVDRENVRVVSDRLAVEHFARRKLNGQKLIIAVAGDVADRLAVDDHQTVRMLPAKQRAACNELEIRRIDDGKLITRLDRGVDFGRDRIVPDVADLAAQRDAGNQLIAVRIDDQHGRAQFVRDEDSAIPWVVGNAVGKDASG